VALFIILAIVIFMIDLAVELAIGGNE